MPEVEAERTRLLEEAKAFRRMADELAAAGVRSPEADRDAAAALRAAQIKMATDFNWRVEIRHSGNNDGSRGPLSRVVTSLAISI
jgi:hypothetical protein